MFAKYVNGIVKTFIHTVGGALAFFERGSSSEDDSSLLLPDFLFLGAGFFSAFLFGVFLELTFFVGAFFALDVVLLPLFFLDLGSYINQSVNSLYITNFIRIFTLPAANLII